MSRGLLKAKNFQTWFHLHWNQHDFWDVGISGRGSVSPELCYLHVGAQLYLHEVLLGCAGQSPPLKPSKQHKAIYLITSVQNWELSFVYFFFFNNLKPGFLFPPSTKFTFPLSWSFIHGTVEYNGKSWIEILAAPIFIFNVLKQN